MLEVETLSDALVSLRFAGGSSPEDARRLMATLQALADGGGRFALVVETDGGSAFPPAERKVLAAWLRRNKPMLRERCAGIARVAREVGLLAKLSSKAMRALVPAPLLVTDERDAAVSWARRRLAEP
jgi:hypothetical protein